MKPYPVEFREKIVKAYEKRDTSIRKLASRFDVSKSFVERLLRRNQATGDIKPLRQGGHQKSELHGYTKQIQEMVEKYPDATLSEYCEYLGDSQGIWVSVSTMCRELQKQKLTRKKKSIRSSQAATERVQKLRAEYWEKIKDIEVKNLIFLDEMGLLLGLTRSHGRSDQGTRVCDFKPFYRGAKVTTIGAISIDRVVALMTMDNSMDGKAFEVFIEKFLVPELWVGAVVVMDNLPAHKIASIAPMIEAVGASIINLSPYSPDFNPIELWWSQLKAFLRQFSPTTTRMVDILIATALDLINPQHLKHWFAKCCYCLP